MQTTAGLFGDIEVGPVSSSARKISQAAERRRLAKFAYDATCDKWRDAYARFILEFAAGRESFIAESVREAYEKRKDLPQLSGSDYRASGQIFMRLVREGKLVRVGYEDSVKRSSPMPKYRLAIGDK
jgi:hypothetical protein